MKTRLMPVTNIVALFRASGPQAQVTRQSFRKISPSPMDTTKLKTLALAGGVAVAAAFATTDANAQFAKRLQGGVKNKTEQKVENRANRAVDGVVDAADKAAVDAVTPSGTTATSGTTAAPEPKLTTVNTGTTNGNTNGATNGATQTADRMPNDRKLMLLISWSGESTNLTLYHLNEMNKAYRAGEIDRQEFVKRQKALIADLESKARARGENPEEIERTGLPYGELERVDESGIVLR